MGLLGGEAQRAKGLCVGHLLNILCRVLNNSVAGCFVVVSLLCAGTIQAQDFAACSVETDDNAEELAHRDHTLGYVSYETHKRHKSIVEITYTFMDCATGDTVYVDFLESHRKKKNIGGTNVSAMAIAIRELIADTQPSWGNNVDRLTEALDGIEAEYRREDEEPLSCSCRVAYPEIER